MQSAGHVWKMSGRYLLEFLLPEYELGCNPKYSQNQKYAHERREAGEESENGHEEKASYSYGKDSGATIQLK